MRREMEMREDEARAAEEQFENLQVLTGPFNAVPISSCFAGAQQPLQLHVAVACCMLQLHVAASAARSRSQSALQHKPLRICAAGGG